MSKRADSAITDLQLWTTSAGVQVVVAEDSGNVRLVDPRNTADSILLTSSLRESALRLSIDSINKSSETLLTVGYS